MTHSIEATGKTIEQALQKALKELNSRPEDVDIEILPGANKGFLGGLFGSKMVSIRVDAPGGQRGAATTSRLSRKSSRNCSVYMGVDYELTIETLPDTTFININSEGLDGLLIGRRGETLASLQHVVNRVFTSQDRGAQQDHDRRRRVHQEKTPPARRAGPQDRRPSEADGKGIRFRTAQGLGSPDHPSGGVGGERRDDLHDRRRAAPEGRRHAESGRELGERGQTER